MKRKRETTGDIIEVNSILELKEVLSLLLCVPVRNGNEVSSDWLCKSKPLPDWLVCPLPCCESVLVRPPSRLQLEVKLFVVERRDGSGTECSRTFAAVRLRFSVHPVASFTERTAVWLVIFGTRRSVAFGEGTRTPRWSFRSLRRAGKKLVPSYSR